MESENQRIKEEVEKDIMIKAGAIRKTMKDSKTIISAFDTKTGIMSAEGKALLDKYKTGGLDATTLKTPDKQIFNKTNNLKTNYINN